MTPVEALCLLCIKHWIRIVEYKNGFCGEIDGRGVAWTRCSATEVARWIGEHLEADVSSRQCQNALRSLEESGRVIREKRWVNKWTQAYSYALPTTDQSSSPEKVNRPLTTDQLIEHPEANHSYRSTSLSTKKSAVGSIEENDVDGLHVPMAQETTSSDQSPEPERHGIVRRHPESSKASVNKSTYELPNSVSGDHTLTTDETSKPGVIGDVQPIESHRLLSEIEKATLGELGAPDLKTDPSGYLNWVLDRREGKL